ncbi:MAG: hypothetical protein V3U64_00410 [Cocleimonas sp.]
MTIDVGRISDSVIRHDYRCVLNLSDDVLLIRPTRCLAYGI